MTSNLSGATVLIVGASSGIGLAVAQRSAAAGAHVVMASRSISKLDAAANGLPAEARARARTVAMDMLDVGAVGRAVASLDGLDHVVLTAVDNELANKARIAEITDAQVEKTFDKLRGFTNVVRAAAPKLRPGGSIVIVTGASALRPPREGFALLAAASGSLLAFGKALALELAPVRVNVVVSGVVDTAIHESRREQVKAWAEKDLPARRFGHPDDLAHAIETLLTNPYMTGSTTTVDGGFVLV